MSDIWRAYSTSSLSSSSWNIGAVLGDCFSSEGCCLPNRTVASTLGSLHFSAVRLRWQHLPCFTLISLSVWISVSPHFLRLSFTPLGTHTRARTQIDTPFISPPTRADTFKWKYCMDAQRHKHTHIYCCTQCLPWRTDARWCKCEVLRKKQWAMLCFQRTADRSK